MASRVLTRSKALAQALSRADAAASSPLYGVRSLRALSTLPQNPAAAADSSQRRTSVCSPLDAPKAAGRPRNGRPSSITNHKDLLHKQNMKIIRLQNEIEITKADMEVLRADMKLEVTKGQTTILNYCMIILGAALVGPLLVEWVAA